MLSRVAGSGLIALLIMLVPVTASPSVAASAADNSLIAQGEPTPADPAPDAEPRTETPTPDTPDNEPANPPDPEPDTPDNPTDPPPSEPEPQPDDPGDPTGPDADPDAESDAGGDEERASLQPSVVNSGISTGSIALALLVLIGVGLAASMLSRRPRTRDESTSTLFDVAAAEPIGRWPNGDVDDGRSRDAADDTATLEFLLGIGELLVDAGDAVNHVETTLRTIAEMNGLRDVGVMVMPTALIVSVPGTENVATKVSTAGHSPLRLDQIDDALELVRSAEWGMIDPIAGNRRVASIRSSPPPFTPGVVLAGYAFSTVGLAMILRATWQEAILAAGLGLIVGVLRLSTRRLGSAYQPFVPLIAAAGVSTTVFVLARLDDDLAVFPLLVAPLITFLPGALLTIGVLELAVGQIVSGASRLASGAMQLVILALGIVAGGQLVGVPAGDLRGNVEGPLGVLAPWIGVAAFGIGVVWFNGARSSARLWIILVLYVAFAGQVIGGLFFGGSLSAFFGALAMTPVAILAARQPSGPTPLVTFLPGFWILVPGALGLEGVARLFGDNGQVGTGLLITAIASMIGISLGILLGLILAANDPEHPWVDAHGSDSSRRRALIPLLRRHEDQE